jgi:putative transposase
VSIREELILKVLAKEDSVVELAQQYGVSRKTIYKWLSRYESKGLSGLVDESRRPKRSPMKTSAELALEIVQLRKEHPRWGPKKIVAIMARRHPGMTIPSVVTVARVLRDAGLQQRVLRRQSGGLSAAPAHLIPTEPNDLWTVDFKGWWRTKDGTRCDPLTIREGFSRYMLALQLLTRTRTEDVRPIFERLFDKFGLPKAIQSDNGPPFASTRALGGLTPLSAWWVSLGIRVVRSRPGRPTDNGAHERMHFDMRFDLEDHAAQDLVAQQRACEDWLTTFNHVRPHEALQQRTPAEVYRVSTRRPTPRTIGGFPEGCRMVRVNGHGNIHADGWKAYVNHALAQYTVGLEFRDPEVRVWFFDVLLGAFDPRTQQSVEPIAPPSERK